jgi:hypothetical protein
MAELIETHNQNGGNEARIAVQRSLARCNEVHQSLIVDARIDLLSESVPGCGPNTGARERRKESKMNHSIEQEMVTIDEVIGNNTGRRLNLHPNGTSGFQTVNARGVGFIAKPGMIQDLRNSICDKVMDHLRVANGFSSAIVLTSNKEPRLVLVLTFWKTEAQARSNSWEHAPAVREMLQPLIDVCSKVQTYKAAMPKSSRMTMPDIEKRAS